jgi:amino acid adenylation domain-containing protein
MKDFLAQLRKSNIYLSLTDGDISVKYLSEDIDTNLLQEIRSKKGDLVDYLSSLNKSSFSSIHPIGTATDYPVSSAQKRLWILSQMEEANAAYNVPMICTFDGDLKITELENAFRVLIARHESLRTVFRENNKGDIRQLVHAAGSIRFSIHGNDLQHHPSGGEEVHTMVQGIISKPFVLSEGPLLTAHLLQVAQQQYVFVCVMHHIISDGWSAGVMMNELLTVYNAGIRGQQHPLMPLRIQYKDYAAWQNDQLSGEKLRQHRQYWLQQFEDGMPVLDFPADRGRPGIKTYNGAVVNKKISTTLLKEFKVIVQVEGATMFMGLLGLVNALLFRYTGQDDIIVGSPVAGRDHVDLEDQIGFYVNMLALRTRFDKEDNYSRLLQRVKQVTLGAYEHQVYPFDALVDDVYRNSDKSRHPLFDVVVVLQNTNYGSREEASASLGDVNVTPYGGADRIVSLFDMRLDFREADDALFFMVEYNSDIYDRERMERFGDNLIHLMEAIVLQPAVPLRRLNYISSREQQQLLANISQAAYPETTTIVELFEAQVDRTPDHVAITLHDSAITYRMLDERANRIAGFLIHERKLQPEEGVAIILGREPDCIAAMLGILKAGGMYIPMEADQPEERLKFMINDAGVKVLITGKAFLETANRLQWSCPSLEAYLCIDSEDVYAEKEQAENVMMSQELWDHVGEKAVDQITGGGWGDSFTGKAIPAEEMEEYAMNAYRKLAPLLHKDMRVLEIGCSSGLTMNKIAPEVGFFYGTDLSPVILENTRAMIAAKGMTNIKLKNVVAHDIATIEERDFDLVIINSVIQHFHGHNYLRQVIGAVTGLMKDTGKIFIGDIMDAGRKEALIHELTAFKIQHKGEGLLTKTDFSADLFVAKGFFEDLTTEDNAIAGVEMKEKIFTIENELTRYRYDAILEIDKKKVKAVNGKRNKYQYSNTVLRRQPASRPALPLSPQNLAYVIYTSGTTGQPKGVLVQHYNVVRLFMTDRPLFDFSESDVWTMFHSYSFDFSVWEMYGALLYGGRLVLVPKVVAQDAAAYLQLLSREQVTVLNQTPSAFYNLSEEAVATDDQPLHLRYVIFGGEALSPGRLKAWNAKYPAIQLINMYGITETTVHVTYKEITSTEIENNISNIGKPIPTLSCYILDPFSNLLPVGVPGELYIGGGGVARGYLNRPELTAARFLLNPFRENDVLYRSGDKVKLLENGEMEYLGRMDHQVKIRGYRIELGEIETALLKQEQMSEVKVIALAEQRTGNKNLVAYIVGEAAIDVKELRSFLATLLPEYMVPSFFVPLPQFPLTRNGKIDTNALPDPLQSNLDGDSNYVAPRNELESKLVSIWSEILSRERIGVHDNFFELGGHSLKAMQLKSRMQKDFGIRVELRDVFSHTSISAQTRLLTGNKNDAYTGIPTVEEQAYYPLSHSQRRFWLLSQLEESAVAYNMPGVIFLEGDLQPAALEQAINYVLQRHESLRTVFRTDDAGEVRQVILKEEQLDFSIRYIDISDNINPDKVLEDLYAEEQSTVFDLSGELLIKVKIVRIKEGLYAFYYLIHHIICDGWSMEILAGEVATAYNSYCNNTTPVMPPLRIQYKDYASWKAQQAAGEQFKLDEDYWLQHFSGRLPVLDMPTDYVRPPAKTFKGDSIERTLPEDLVQALRGYCSQEGATLFMGLLAGLKGLIYRYSGQNDIVVGAPIAGREHLELENQVGLYLNTLALRTRFNGTDTFDTLLAKVKEVLLGGYSHGAYPFDLLVENLHLKKDMSRSLLFDVWVVLQNQRSTNVNSSNQGMEGLSMREFENRKNETSQFDLLFNFNEKEEEVQLLLNYSTDLYSAATIERFYDHYIRFLQEVIAASGQPLCSVNFLTPAERRMVTGEFNNTALEFPAGATVLRLFEEQVKNKPGAIAVVYEDKQLTYEVLNERANQLAAYLQVQHGLQRGAVAAIMMNRSEHLIVALLAVMKTGAAYVPVDPAYPEERCSYILNHAKAVLVLTDKNIVPAFYHGNRVVVEEIGDANGKLYTKQAIQPDDLAYIMYTSGSTGTPKGCMITHYNLANYIQWANGYYFENNTTGNWALITSLSFDLTVTSIYTSLTRGMQLYVGSAEKEITQLLEDCFRHPAIDTLKLTPSHLLLLRDLQIGDTAVRRIICGGEQLTATQVNIVKQIDSRIRLYNEYGPTETTVGCVVKEIVSAEERILIGKPVANMEIYIMNEAMILCPPGVSGEIYIGGAAVGAGYFDHPALTATRFLPNPYRPGEKMYRSGDVGQWLANGDIAFSGRADSQVKVNGYRVEPDEIKQVLLQYEGIRDAVVVARKSATADGNYLVAYFVPEKEIAPEGISAVLRKRLPAYMIPQYFVQMDALPVTDNGKTDLLSLPDPQGAEAITGAPYTAPGNEVEEQLANVWESVLGLARVGIHDNFFELGGTSLNVMQLNSAMKKRMGIEMTLRDIVANPTIAQISAAKFSDRAAAELPAQIQVFGGKVDPLRSNVFFIPPSSGISYWYMELLREMKADINGFFLNLRGIFDNELPYSNIDEITAGFLQHILPYTTTGKPVFLVGYSSGGPLIAELATLLESKGFKAVLFILDAVPKAVYEEPIRDRETFVSTIFPDLERFRKLAAGIHADNAALEKFLDMAFNFHCLWPDHQQPAVQTAANAFVFANRSHKENLAPYHAWRHYLTGDIEFIILEEGEHTALLQYPENISLISNKIKEVLRFF